MYRMLLIVAFVLAAGPVNPTAHATPNTGAAKALIGAAMQQALFSNAVHRKVCKLECVRRAPNGRCRPPLIRRCFWPPHH